MPKVIEATLLRDETAYPWVDLESGRKRAQRTYRVNTDDVDLVFTAAGLPGLFSAWGPEHPDLLVQSVRPRYEGGGDVDDDIHGFTRVTVNYATSSGQPEVLVAQDGDAYTELAPGTTTLTIRYDIAGAPIPETQIEVESTEVIVRSYRASFPVVAWRDITNPVAKLNANGFVLPPTFGVPNSGIPVLPGQLRPRTYQVDRARDGILVVSYRFAYAADWKFRYRNEDQNGNPTGPVVASDVYESATFDTAALWGA